MRRQHEAHLRLRQHLPDLPGGDAPLGQHHDHLVKRAPARRIRVGVLPPSHPSNPLVILGKVDQLEVVRERANQHPQLARVGAVNHLVQPDTIVPLVAPQVLGESTHLFLERERLLARRRSQDIAQQPGQQVNIVGNRPARNRFSLPCSCLAHLTPSP